MVECLKHARLHNILQPTVTLGLYPPPPPVDRDLILRSERKTALELPVRVTLQVFMENIF